MKLNVCLGAALMLWQGAAFAQSTYGTIYGTITDPSSGVIRDAVVPIVPGAIVFDLLNGGDKSWGRFPPYRDLGYEAAAIRIQDAFLGGRKTEAAAAVPDALIDEIALVGCADRIRDRLQAWKEAGKHRHVDSMLLRGDTTIEALRVIAEAVL